MCHRPKPKSVIIDSSRLPLRNLFYFNQTASAIPGLIQVVALATTGVQLWVGQQNKLENDTQQRETERILRQQLEALQSMNKQLSEGPTAQNGKLVLFGQG